MRKILIVFMIIFLFSCAIPRINIQTGVVYKTMSPNVLLTILPSDFSYVKDADND